jgi:pimeloyl-ACP methyl ester carboxylesterase
MPTIDMDGSTTHYEVSGSGPPALMMAPGGFDSAIEKWSATRHWQRFSPLQTFAREGICIAYDRRGPWQSGGRVEQLTWAAYAHYWDVHLESQPPDHRRDRILHFVAPRAGVGVHP